MPAEEDLKKEGRSGVRLGLVVIGEKLNVDMLGTRSNDARFGLEAADMHAGQHHAMDMMPQTLEHETMQRSG